VCGFVPPSQPVVLAAKPELLAYFAQLFSDVAEVCLNRLSSLKTLANVSLTLLPCFSCSLFVPRLQLQSYFAELQSHKPELQSDLAKVRFCLAAR
jgi:hypothetical protein